MPSNLVMLLVHNDKVAQTLTEACRDRGAELERAESLSAALDRLNGAGGGALVLDLAELSTKSDKKINAVISSIEPNVKVLGLGSGYDVKAVTSYFRSGLTDFLDLPLDPFLLSRALNNIFGSLSSLKDDAARSAFQRPLAPPKNAALAPAKNQERRQKEDQSSGLRGAGAPEPLKVTGGAIVGQDPGLMKVFRMVEKVAATDSTVMIHGESGTGKELIARAIHQSSPRSQKPMIPVNCGAIPEELLETELFGHEKGAFTNAIRDRTGRFEMADGGTIFLDEIGDMSPKLQVKLLRVIQEHEFERVGGDKTIAVNIRVITATHVDLARAVEEGRFREDLFYRLNVIPLTIPPLRARSGDIPLLVEFFLSRLRETRGSKVTGLTPEVLSILKAYRWPGNIRELENLMERMVILADGPILTREDLPQRLLALVEGQIQGKVAAKIEPRIAPEAQTQDRPSPQDKTSPQDNTGLQERSSPQKTLRSQPEYSAQSAPLPNPDLALQDQPFWPDFSRLPSASFEPGSRSRTSHQLEPAAFEDENERQRASEKELQDGVFKPESAKAEFQTENTQTYGSQTAEARSDRFQAHSESPSPEGVGKGAITLPLELYHLFLPLMSFPEQGVDLSTLLGDFEDRLIREALKASSGVKNQAAKALGLSRTTFLDKLKKRGLD